jgi:hypothetical protein
VFVSLASIRDARFVASAIAEALGLASVSASDLRLNDSDRPHV